MTMPLGASVGSPRISRLYTSLILNQTCEGCCPCLACEAAGMASPRGSQVDGVLEQCLETKEQASDVFGSKDVSRVRAVCAM